MRVLKTKRTTPPATAAFSLTEIIVAIAIIVILGTLLVPVVKLVQDTSHSVKCANNLHQIGLGLTAYANEHGGVFPHRYVQEGSRQDPDDANTWMQKAGRYLNISDEEMRTERAVGPFICPKWVMKPDRKVSYALPRLIDPDRCMDKPGRSWNYRAMNTAPASTFIVVEIADNDDIASELPDRNNSVQRRHPRDSANYLFVDGHVENIPGVVSGNDFRWYKN